MNRRTLVRSLAALAAGAVGAGCTNNLEVPATAPEVPVTATQRDITEIPDDDDRIDPPTPPADDGGNVITIPSNVSTRRPGGPTPTRTASDEPTPTPDRGTPTPTSRLETDGFGLSSDDDGELVVTVTVRNESTRERSGRVLVVVEDDGETYERSKSVKVSTGREQSLPFSFPTDYDPAEPPDVSVTLSQGTPLPTTDGS